jgi:hypothetical protein
MVHRGQRGSKFTHSSIKIIQMINTFLQLIYQINLLLNLISYNCKHFFFQFTPVLNKTTINICIFGIWPKQILELFATLSLVSKNCSHTQILYLIYFNLLKYDNFTQKEIHWRYYYEFTNLDKYFQPTFIEKNEKNKLLHFV